MKKGKLKKKAVKDATEARDHARAESEAAQENVARERQEADEAKLQVEQVCPICLSRTLISVGFRCQVDSRRISR